MRTAKSILVLMFLFFVAFGAASQTATKTGQVVIGLALPQIDEYQNNWLAFVKPAAEQFGAKLILTNADGSIEKQVADIESLIVQKPDVIMIRTLDSKGIVGSINAVRAARIPVVISSYQANTDNYDLYLFAQQTTTGRMQADYLKSLLQKNPGMKMNICYIWGSPGLSGCADRYNGFKANFIGKDYPNVKIIDERIGNWSAAEAMAITEDWMQSKKDMNVIVCQNDEMAVGACNALVAAGKNMDQYIVVGIDGTKNGQAKIREKQLDATIYTNLKADAYFQIEHAAGLARGMKYPKDLELTTKRIMTLENIDQILAEAK